MEQAIAVYEQLVEHPPVAADADLKSVHDALAYTLEGFKRGAEAAELSLRLARAVRGGRTR
jgi:hypothetical protein